MRIEHGSFLVFPVSWRINVQKSRDDSAEGETRVLQSVRTLQKSRPELAIQVLRAKFEKRVKISRVFDFFRSSQALGTS